MKLRLTWLLVPAGLLVGILLGGVKPSSDNRLIFFSVGQGDAALIQYEGKNILIDAGPANEYTDAGKLLLFPKLRALGVRKIDLVILTHPDSDHIGGLKSLAERIPVGDCMAHIGFRTHPDLIKLYADLNIAKSDQIWVSKALQITHSELKLSIYPPPFSAGDQDNEGSLFIHLQTGNDSAVMTGDAGMFTEAVMLPLRRWNANWLKAGHHGSRFSLSSEWLNAVQPKEVIFSAGRTNRYGHPHPDAMNRALAVGSKIRRTDIEGDISFELD